METTTQTRRTSWRPALFAAIPIALVVLALFYDWFAVADRYAIFLYGHSATGIKLTQPFDEMTSSRYWMAGLVATGIVLVLYTAANVLLGRLAARQQRRYVPPQWWRVWLLCAPVLAVGIPVITMTANNPTLPASLAVACTAATLAGLALALLPGALAAEHPGQLLWLAGDGVGLALPLLLIHALELPGRGLSISVAAVRAAAIGSVVLCIIWLAIMSGLRAWRRKPIPTAAAILASGGALSYLLLPLVHYVLATPPKYRYITNSANFFASSWGLQIVTWLVAALLALGATWLRRRFARSKAVRTQADG